MVPLKLKNRYKYPSIPNECDFEGEVVITEKLDGELAVIYSDGYYHTRSLKPSNHPSREAIRSIAYGLNVMLPRGWRICGENLFAQHTIYYRNLPSYFFVFSVFTDLNMCLSWESTVDFCEQIGVHVVPFIYEGKYNQFTWDGKSFFETLDSESLAPCLAEGYVVRKKSGLHVPNIAKYVRPDFVKRSRLTLKNHVTGSVEFSEKV